eukprot:9245272-Pyramimonas_sp.AAC.1
MAAELTTGASNMVRGGKSEARGVATGAAWPWRSLSLGTGEALLTTGASSIVRGGSSVVAGWLVARGLGLSGVAQGL